MFIVQLIKDKIKIDDSFSHQKHDTFIAKAQMEGRYSKNWSELRRFEKLQRLWQGAKRKRVMQTYLHFILLISAPQNKPHERKWV